MRVAIYVRVSTEEQAMRGLSLGDQERVCRKWCEDRDYNIIDVYIDAGVSGRKVAKKRPALQKLLRDVEADKIDLIIFTRLDRWFRNTQQYFIVDAILSEHHVSWNAILENHETQTAAGQFEVTIMLGMAQMEADNTSARLKFTFDQKRKRGEALGGKAPLGLEIVDKKLRPSEQAYIVDELFKHYIGTRSMTQTAKWLEDTYGIHYCYQGIRTLLQNERYLEQGLISQDTWDTVVRIRQGHDVKLVRSDRIYLFASMCVCKDCGHRIHATITHTHDKIRIYYRCPNSHSHGNCINNWATPEWVIEEYLKANILTKVNERNDFVISQQKKAEKKIDLAAIERKKEKLVDLYLADKISKDKYTAEYDRLTAMIPQVNIKPIDTKEVISALELYDRLPQEGKRYFWANIVDTIYIGKDRSIDFSLL